MLRGRRRASGINCLSRGRSTGFSFHVFTRQIDHTADRYQLKRFRGYRRRITLNPLLLRLFDNSIASRFSDSTSCWDWIRPHAGTLKRASTATDFRVSLLHAGAISICMVALQNHSSGVCNPRRLRSLRASWWLGVHIRMKNLPRFLIISSTIIVNDSDKSVTTSEYSYYYTLFNILVSHLRMRTTPMQRQATKWKGPHNGPQYPVNFIPTVTLVPLSFLLLTLLLLLLKQSVRRKRPKVPMAHCDEACVKSSSHKNILHEFFLSIHRARRRGEWTCPPDLGVANFYNKRWKLRSK